ncbi:vacuolar iron transporter homolog 4-like [Actinidia eriantha]|uniref:vacuolar iron transporter homolog 4-like n=1 Tax=Actinidia eriantha TaxID=165200 RepID=UPI00258B065F|nr:vacuolar iron transporter homolog 4-like [Actinidia eriantha]
MASNQSSLHEGKFSIPNQNLDQQATVELGENDFDYSKRSQWLRAAVLGATDGLVSTAALMLGVGAVKQDIKNMIITGFAGLVAGACSMAIGEFVSVYSQLDIEVAQAKREKKKKVDGGGERKEGEEEEEKEKEGMPNPVQAAAASALAFSVGAMVPLLAASFIKDYRVRLGVVVAAVSLALAVFGCLGAALGKAPSTRAAIRVLVGGWLAMAITYGLTKLIGSSGLQ